MSSLFPAAVYGLEVPAGDVLIPAEADFPATFRITMAAIDPTSNPEYGTTVNGDVPPRATLKLIRRNSGPNEDDSEIDSEEEDSLAALLNGAASSDEDDEESSDDEMVNGGPSDPSKGKQSRQAREDAGIEQLKKALAENNNNTGVKLEGTDAAISKKLDKGKAKATISLDEEDEEDDEEEFEEFVLCTLDPAQNYQQPLDITVGENEQIYFKVSGTHTVYLTGNYVVLPHDHESGMHDDEDEEEDYDLSPDEDELDEIDDPRIMEVDSEDDDEPPKLIKAEKIPKKGKNKRAAEESDDEPAGLDDIMAKALKPEEPKANGEPKLSKKQAKKLKNNAGKAVEAETESKNVKVDSAVTESPSLKDRKVQFSEQLEQGPSGKTADAKLEANGAKKSDSKKESDKPKASLGSKTVQGVKVEDKKLGTGPAAKKGDKVGMRYIGKLADGKQFDANKKGKPFTFKLGAGEVIKGWDIGVAGMSIGGERRIIVPANLAYGSKSLPGIPANSQLTFDMKLLEIQ